MLSIKGKAEEILNSFEEKERDNGEKYIYLKDGSPDWMQDVIREAHNEMFPNDIKYLFIREALTEIARDDIDHPEDIVMEADIYTHDLLKWVSSHLGRIDYMDEVTETFGPFKSFTSHLMAGQEAEKSEILYSLLESLGKLE